jgi:hypothetical protein
MDTPVVVEDRARETEAGAQALLGASSDGYVVGGLVSLRHKWFVVAPSITYTAELLTSHETFAYRLGAGPSWTPLPWLRLEALGVGGAHVYRGVGSEFLGSRGADGTRAFLGAWAGASARGGPFRIGLWAYYEGDLDRGQILTNDPVTRDPTAWFGDTQHPVTVGQDVVGVLLRVGVGFDL